MSTSPAYLKQAWAALPDWFFETLTFEELQTNDKFIGLPVPGDNEGHGGFKVSHTIFIKLENGLAISENTGTVAHFPHPTLVIKVI